MGKGLTNTNIYKVTVTLHKDVAHHTNGGVSHFTTGGSPRPFNHLSLHALM